MVPHGGWMAGSQPGSSLSRRSGRARPTDPSPTRRPWRPKRVVRMQPRRRGRQASTAQRLKLFVSPQNKDVGPALVGDHVEPIPPLRSEKEERVGHAGLANVETGLGYRRGVPGENLLGSIVRKEAFAFGWDDAGC